VQPRPPQGAQNAPRFSLGYAPHEGSFKSRGNRLEQIAFAADQGFTAWEDNEAAGRPVEEQVAMARALRLRYCRLSIDPEQYSSLLGPMHPKPAHLAAGRRSRARCNLERL
jgi:hypothetical protein